MYEQERRRATTPGAVITPGSNFDASEVDRYYARILISVRILISAFFSVRTFYAAN